MTGLNITVHGIPAPQGSKRHVGNGRMIESSARVKPWRDSVIAAAVDAKGGCDCVWELITGPVVLYAYFYFQRPKSHYGTGRNAGKLKLSAPPRPAGPPDLSKLIRSTEDALTEAGVWRDDALVVAVRSDKYYSSNGFTGAQITVAEYRKGL